MIHNTLNPIWDQTFIFNLATWAPRDLSELRVRAHHCVLTSDSDRAVAVGCTMMSTVRHRHFAKAR